MATQEPITPSSRPPVSSINYVAWGGLKTHSKEIATDFYRLNNAKWRYLLASVVAG